MPVGHGDRGVFAEPFAGSLWGYGRGGRGWCVRAPGAGLRLCLDDGFSMRARRVHTYVAGRVVGGSKGGEEGGEGGFEGPPRDCQRAWRVAWRWVSEVPNPGQFVYC